MKKITSLITLICALFITTATAQINQTVVFDFTNNAWGIKTITNADPTAETGKKTYSDGEKSITITARGGRSFYYDNDCLRMDKEGNKLSLPAFSFNVDKIEVIGHAKAASYPNADINIQVGNNAVSTPVAGLKDSHVFEIAPEYQAAGKTYDIVIGAGGGTYSSVVYITYIKVYPADSDDAITLKAPVLDNGSGVYTEPVTTTVSSPTTEIEGVENVTYYYTTNGYVPDNKCNKAENGQIAISESCILKVILEFTYNGETYTSEPTTAEYIISEAVTYKKATTFIAGNYFIVAEGNIALPFKDGKLPTKATNVKENNVTDAKYYAFNIIENKDKDGNIIAEEFCIKDANDLYLTAYMGNTDEIKSTTTTDNAGWNITIEENGAKIRKGDYILVYKNNNIVAIKEINATATEIYPTLYTFPQPKWWTDYDNTTTVKEFEKLSIGFENIESIVLNDAKPVLYNSAGASFNGTAELIEETSDKDGKTTYKIEVTFEEKITEPSEYSLSIPAGMFTMNNEINNKEKLLTFTIVEPVEITPLEVESVTPKFGENGQLEEIEIVYNQRVYFGNPESSWSCYVVNLTDANGNQHPMWQKDPYDPTTLAQIIPNNTVVLIPVKLNEDGLPYEMNEFNQYIASPIIADGEYTLNLADVFVRFGYDATTHDYNTSGCCEGTYTWKIPGDTAIDGIEAETENAEIYDLTGRRVENITKVGIYIVGGKKVLVK